MSSLVEKLTAQGTGESAVFLDNIVAALWPNINVAVGQLIKETVEPMLKSSLPGPLSSLHFTKIELGSIPIQLSNVRSTKLESGAIELDLNVDWEGKCDIELDGDYVPTLGVESIKLKGSLNVILAPLTNVLPLIGAAQFSFINPPILSMDFTGAANIADFSLIHDTVHSSVLDVINGMLTIPNRYLYKLDTKNDYFKTYMEPLGILRVTAEKAWGFSVEAKTAASKLFAKLTRAAPDCYAKTTVGAEGPWKTSTQNNTTSPAWNETHDFLVSDYDQCIKVDVYDADMDYDHLEGTGVTTVREILRSGTKQELVMEREGKETEGKVSISCEYFKFASDGASFSAADHKGDGLQSGLATILVAGAYSIKGQRQELKPSVVVTWGEKHRFQTAIMTDAPGTDINNPAFDQAFRMPVTSDLLGGDPPPFRIALLNGEKEMGKIDVPYKDVQSATDMTLQDYFDVGEGAAVRASISLRGLESGKTQVAELPERRK